MLDLGQGVPVCHFFLSLPQVCSGVIQLLLLQLYLSKHPPGSWADGSNGSHEPELPTDLSFLNKGQ